MKFSSPLSEELREKYRRRSIRPRAGDTVKILRGEFKGVEGKVTKVLASRGKLNVEGVVKEKAAGGTSPLPIDPSKVVVTSLNLEDRLRKAKLGES